MEDPKIRNLEKEIQELKVNRGRFLLKNPGKSVKWFDDKIQKLNIALIQREIELGQTIYTQRSTLGQILPDDPAVRDKVCKKVVAISLAADFLIDTVEEFKASLDEYGVDSPDITHEVNRVVELAQKTASRLLQLKSHALDTVLLDNQDLIEKLTEETMLYIDKTMK